MGKWCSREDLHLEPRSSQNRMQNSYTSGAWEKLVRHAGAAPAFPVWKTGVLLLHQ